MTKLVEGSYEYFYESVLMRCRYPTCLFFLSTAPSSHVIAFEMDSGNIVIDSDMAYPLLFIPKKCTTLETNCELSDNLYIDVNITSRDTQGTSTSIYKGFCNIKVVDSYDPNLNVVESPDSSVGEQDIDQMPVILSEANQSPSYNQSQVWIDPSRSPYVYNHCDPSEQYSIRETGELITVEQHNTYITQNVYNCKESNVVNYRVTPKQSPVKDFECKRTRKQEMVTNSQPNNNQSYGEEDEYECGVFLSQMSGEIVNEKQSRVTDETGIPGQENNALKQLMSSDIQSTSKQRKTILFLGHDSQSGQTIQNISYNDPLVRCAEMDVENEVVIDASSPNPMKKKYQCDKCKQIFDQISSFRQHMVGNHTNYRISSQSEKELSFMCTDCGKNLKNQRKFEIHCLGHGDPDLECRKCRKVFASKFSLRVHMKIHNRTHPCNYCIKSYGSHEELRIHSEKIHFLHMCPDENCSFVSGKLCDLDNHQHWEKIEVIDPEAAEIDLNNLEEITLKSEVVGQELISLSQVGSNQDLSRSNQDLSGSNQDLSGSNQDLSKSNQELSRSNQDVSGSSQELMSSSDSQLNHNLERSNQELPKSSQDFTNPSLERSSRDVIESSLDLARSHEDLRPSMEDNEGERIRKADSVIAKVMSNKIFLLSSKKARRHRCRKTCEVCLKSFDRIDDLKRHLIEHVIRSTLAKTPVTRTGSLKITCEICQAEAFNKVDKYKAHLREHAKLTIYKCTFCDKSFSDSSNFSKHKKIHGVSYLQCDLCNRKFNSKKMIAQHMDHHTKTAPVQCGYCDRIFHFESMLNKHVRCAHKKEETSKFRCKFCEEIFRSLKEKWDHEWDVHNVRKMIVDCRICGAQYRKYSELKRHCLDEHEVDIPPAKKLLKRKYACKVSLD